MAIDFRISLGLAVFRCREFSTGGAGANVIFIPSDTNNNDPKNETTPMAVD